MHLSFTARNEACESDWTVTRLRLVKKGGGDKGRREREEGTGTGGTGRDQVVYDDVRKSIFTRGVDNIVLDPAGVANPYSLSSEPCPLSNSASSALPSRSAFHLLPFISLTRSQVTTRYVDLQPVGMGASSLSILPPHPVHPLQVHSG